MDDHRPNGLRLGASHSLRRFSNHFNFNRNHVLTPDSEAQTLALLAYKIASGSKYPFTSVAFKLALSEAYECLQATKEFLKEKEEIARKEGEAYWKSEEGQKRRAEAKASFEEFKKRNNP